MKFPVNELLDWYQKNYRMLPWRRDQNPYHVWISEIMLQQTRIEAVIQYYNRFMEQVPAIHDLATISEEKLLKLWEGLGYYNRAHHLKKAAMMIEQNYNGIFPNTYEDILSLPGIGEYTASAIASICFSLKEVTVDGNVLRVYMRYYGKKDCVDDLKVKKQVRNEFMKIIPEKSGDFNQGLMELGETICLPNGTPKCENCPISMECATRKREIWNSIPVKKVKKQKKIENYTVLLFFYDGKIAVKKRNSTGILKNLYEFPNIEKKNLNELKEYLKEENISYDQIKVGPNYTHIFTHRKWNMNSYVIFLNKKPSFNFFTIEEMDTILALPTAFKPFLEWIKKERV